MVWNLKMLDEIRRNLSYEEVAIAIREAPMTWIPALLKETIVAAIDKKCFKPGDEGIPLFVKKTMAKYAKKI